MQKGVGLWAGCRNRTERAAEVPRRHGQHGDNAQAVAKAGSVDDGDEGAPFVVGSGRPTFCCVCCRAAVGLGPSLLVVVVVAVQIDVIVAATAAAAAAAAGRRVSCQDPPRAGVHVAAPPPHRAIVGTARLRDVLAQAHGAGSSVALLHAFAPCSGGLLHVLAVLKVDGGRAGVEDDGDAHEGGRGGGCVEGRKE